MTDQTAAEPTMEEILASIRRIISEDDAPVETAAVVSEDPEPVAEQEPEPAPMTVAEPEAEVAPPVEDDVLDLTDRYEAPVAESIGDLDVSAPEATPVVSQTSAPIPAAAPGYDSLVGDSAAASAASAFAGLAASFKAPETAPATRGADLNFASGSTVEGMVAEMLRPMLKDWLDANLPGIVQDQVRKEVERIARNAG